MTAKLAFTEILFFAKSISSTNYIHGLGTFYVFNFCKWWRDLQNSRNLNPSKICPIPAYMVEDRGSQTWYMYRQSTHLNHHSPVQQLLHGAGTVSADSAESNLLLQG